MIDSITIFTKGGTVLYHGRPTSPHRPPPPTGARDADKENQRDAVNAFISSVLLGEGKNKNVSVTGHEGPRLETLTLGGGSPVVAEWVDDDVGQDEGRRGWIALAVYPEVAARKLQGVSALLSSLLRRYALFYDHHREQAADRSQNPNQMRWNMQLFVPPSKEFDSAFRTAVRNFLDQLSASASSNSLSSLEKRQRGKLQSNQQSRPTPVSQTSHKKGKEKRVWHDGRQKVTKAALAELDMSKDKDEGARMEDEHGIREDARAVAEARAAYLPSAGERPAWEEEDEVASDIDIQWNAGGGGVGDTEEEEEGPGGVRGFFANLLSPNRPLTKSDLDPPLKNMQQLLTSKNVAPATAKAICEVVERQLLGKRVGTLTGVRRAVRHALEDAVERILRPELGGIGGGSATGFRKGKSVDVLRGVVEKRERGRVGAGGRRPYVIVMIGINGVGKSTSLAKIAYYLQSNQCNPLLAACDTFRSGAVEQLSVHASCLSLPLYHQGYAKDPSNVAKAAISKAAEDGNDVVLIDTAGRMQNNVPLMKALAKLVTEARPDLVLFVCEALVGNDGMDQLTMFQRALTAGGHSRAIDGIVLTKFDTVSDKVGAALTLTHLTGVPIAFCGTGQKYSHLKPLSVPFVIQSLFS
ncbi:hypothetical protein ACHAWF_007753 [Thalassiosira exigua]